MINISQIKPKAPVVCSNNIAVGVVDRVEGSNSIKLAKDANGQHHFVPVTWVKSVDDKVHLDRTGDQVKREWTTTSTKN